MTALCRSKRGKPMEVDMRNKMLKERRSHDYEFHAMPSNALASTIISGLAEETVRSFVFGLIWAVPSVRRRCIKVLITTLLLGVMLGGFTIYYVSGLFDSYLGGSLAREEALPDKNE
jgi:hypothetical protein